MIKEENLKVLKNKSLYKLFLLLLKILPYIVSILVFTTVLLDTMLINTTLINYIIYIILFLFLYIASYVFEYCNKYRWLLHYIMLNNLLSLYDFYIGIKISNITLIKVYILSFGIALFIIIYKHVKNNTRNTNKDNT